MKGQTLRLERIRRGLRQRDVADATGYSRARIGQVERLRTVPPIWADRYRRVLATAKASEHGRPRQAAPEVETGTANEAGNSDASRSD
jgi:transcriptional regulator with XRE-family HTH domain